MGLALYAAASICGAAVQAQTYPTKAVRIVVPSAPGGTTDVEARALAQQLSALWRVPVVVDNRPSHNGNIAAETAAKAQPDGHTLLLATNALALNRVLLAGLTYDAAVDFVAVGAIAYTPFAVLVHPALPVKSLKELIVAAKEQPKKLTQGHSGTGSADHVCGELLKQKAGIRALSMPYKVAAVGGVPAPYREAHYLLATVPAAIALVKSGEARAIAVTSIHRSEVLPDIPAVHESLPGFDCNAWQALFAPSRVPERVLQQIRSAVARAMQTSAILERLEAQGLQPVHAGPRELGSFLSQEISRSAQLVRETRIKLD
jgi:tripartite-type tricarboxylate transporter receptor subunit TctC